MRRCWERAWSGKESKGEREGKQISKGKELQDEKGEREKSY
jgi:hypothetical protein